MKQIIQHLNSGDTSLIEVPSPMVKSGFLLIQSSYSLVSAGTERMLIEFGKANWVNKARMQPERVKTVLDKIKTDGLLPTIDAIKSKINKPIPLGYSNCGIVRAIGDQVTGFRIGDRVVSNGPHAEIVQVPQNLCAKVPDNVSSEAAAFTVVSAIALQGIRLAQPTFGEVIVVIGLGLIGQITVQLLRANGCRVIGIDNDQARCTQAEKLGITSICSKSGESVVPVILSETGMLGADAVLITASSKDNTIISGAAQMSRKRGRIVLVGVVGLDLNRTDFYEKELSFQVSCSYGPGRYDYDYEQNGHDYPIGFVRWTAKRNFEAVLSALSTGQLKVEQFITRQMPLEAYRSVYNTISEAGHIATLFAYSNDIKYNRSVSFNDIHVTRSGSVALIGAGNFAHKVILPILKKAGAEIHIVASENGLNAAQMARQFDIPAATTDLDSIWQNDAIDTVIIAAQHHLHAGLCVKALGSGKNVFVEKPIAIDVRQLKDVKAAYEQTQQIVDVGFNRRHAPLALKMKQLLGGSSLVNIVITVNAGTVFSNGWLNDAVAGGGRIIGEVCHFIDLSAFLSGSTVAAVCTNAMSGNEENVSLLLRFDNGSSAAIQYFANGNKAYDKERVEVYSQGKTIIMENWRRLSAYGFKGFSAQSSSQDKGHVRQFKLLHDRIRQGGGALIPFESIYNTTATAIAAVESLKEQKWISV